MPNRLAFGTTLAARILFRVRRDPAVRTMAIQKSAVAPSITTSNSSSKSSMRNLKNQCIYVTFAVVIWGALVRVYVFEMDEGGKVGQSQNDIVRASLQEFKSAIHKKVKLQCDAYGGPSEADAQEMVYWQGTCTQPLRPREQDQGQINALRRRLSHTFLSFRSFVTMALLFRQRRTTDIPSDSRYVSPFHVQKTASSVPQYMTFEPDGGGWNNIRMAMETVVGLAIATGRTLVLPPEQRFYLLGQGRGQENVKTDFSFMDFFPLKELANDNDGLTIISMEEFLTTVAMRGQLVDQTTGVVTFPPDNRTDWNGIDVKPLKEYLRNVTHTPLWAPEQCLAVFPASGTMEDQNKLQEMMNTIQQEGPAQPSAQYPIPVDATTMERMRESLVRRRSLCMYDHEMQQAPVLHFMCYHKMHVRMLVHFYAFLFFEDYREDLWMKRYVLFLCSTYLSQRLFLVSFYLLFLHPVTTAP